MWTPWRLAAWSALLSMAVSGSAQAKVWAVANTASAGGGSLQAAIDSANSSPPTTRDTILFGIVTPGPYVITMSSTLVVTKSGVVIDGYSQPGASPNTLAVGSDAVLAIVLTTDTTGIDAFQVTGDSCTIRGLVIGGGWNLAINLTGTSRGHVVEGNFIGVDTTGVTAFSNETGIYLVGEGYGRVGGELPGQRNVISGNNNYGVVVGGTGNNVIRGNYIGTDRHGTIDLGNGVGMALSGTAGDSVGGIAPGAGNVISGNIYGLMISGGATSTVVQGNLIGTDAWGVSAMGNDDRGIYLLNSANNKIGGVEAGARNVVSASGTRNILLQENGSTGNWIAGNYIGTDITGQVALPNGSGIELWRADSNLIGGALPAAGNVFAGHVTAIEMLDSADANAVAGNYIGVAADGVTALGNVLGVHIFASRFNMIGGHDPGSGNIIAFGSFNGGLWMHGVAHGNSIASNSFHDNVGPGIDLGGDGVSPNDPLDADTGPNFLQNYPVLTAAVANDGETILNGTLASEIGAPYRIQVFQSGACDPSGFGEGATPLDTFIITTDSVTGIRAFQHSLGTVPAVGSVLTATATSFFGSTSEFSNCVTVTPPVLDDTLTIFLFSPVSMVVTDPLGDSIGIDSATTVIFNTILDESDYDTTSDVNSPTLSGPDGTTDDIVTIPHPLAGDYRIRLFVDDGADDSATFTMGLRIDGNQMLVPDDYDNQDISALGSTVSNEFIWTAATTLPGDANADGSFTSADIIYLVNYVFKSGPESVVPGHGDANCSGAVTSADVILMVNFVFKSGEPPCSQSAG